ncbi:hypothetical protein BDW22DRAFT_1355202 [Trametopsis cervina]|nr:hypothetical protein BDW22DRAFT_1355202 [Trametopsis cervina]
MSPTTPSHWPSEITYINSPRYHSSVTKEVRSQLDGAMSPVKTSQPGGRAQRPPVVIKRIVEDGHPAKGQFGLFAAKKLQARQHIIDYVGEVHCDDRPDSDYDLSLLRLPNGIAVGIDASKAGNEARFINDFRGIADKPNALFQEGRDDSGALSMSVWSGNEPIKKGSEILVSYGKGFWKARHSPSE